MNNISPARRASFEILIRIETEKAFSSVLLPAFEEDLSDLDRTLCHELTLGVLRRKLYLDKIIEKFTKKRIEKFDPEVAAALRLGLYQFLFLDKIPAYSIINESVNLVKFAKKRSAAGLVNAVLRRASREKTISLDFGNELEKLAIETSHPVWLIERWMGQFGLEETELLARANNENPPTAFRPTARFYRQDEARKKEILDQFAAQTSPLSNLATHCFISEKSNETIRQLARAGLIYFQDEASQLVSNVIDLKPGMSFLDVCAAPGSKVTAVCAELGRLGAGQKSKIQNPKSKIGLVVAGDYHPHRARFLRENCLNQGAENVQVVLYDARAELPFGEGSFDLVLVDAPCSGTGTIRHNPEIRYFLEEKDLAELSRKQLVILRNASKLVKRGGRLIYSTCSLEVQENEDVIGEFLTSEGEFEKVLPALPGRFLTEDGFARTFPHRDKTDGFFISILENN